MNSRNLTNTIPGAPNFTYAELIKSNTATARGINNCPSDDSSVWGNLEYLTEQCLQPARDHFGVPLIINSGYRSPTLNKAVGGSNTSFHTWGMAADVVFKAVPNRPSLLDLFKFFFNRGIYTELIIEEWNPVTNTGWVHIAIQKGRELENQLKCKKVGEPVRRASFNEIIALLTKS